MSNTTLATLSAELAQVVEANGQSVLRVDARRRVSGTGIAWTTDGLVVTAHHVIQREEHITVGLPDGESRPATLVGRDPSTGLALLRVDGAALQPPRWSDAAQARVGHLVLALARPGQSTRATLAVVGAAGDRWRTPFGGEIDRYVETNLGRLFGFSGGPLVDVRGEVIGLNTAGLMRGVWIAVPFPTIKRVTDALATHGRVRRGYLGVGVQPVRLPEGTAETTGQGHGVMVISVEPGSPAERAGLFLGDVIVALNGSPIRRPGDLVMFLAAEQVGKSVEARILRGGAVHTVSAVVGERA